MNLSKKIYTSSEVSKMAEKLSKAARLGIIGEKNENNEYIFCSYVGKGEISDKWNIKIYKFNEKKKGHSVVCTDMYVLGRLLKDDFDFSAPEHLKVLKIDDAGWGYPLCGVMVGVTDEVSLKTAVVSVKYFQGENFAEKKYLAEYTRLGLSLVEEFGANCHTHRIEICSGFVNQMLKDELRKRNFHVKIVEIKGMLQDTLEEEFRKHVKSELKTDIYYDPKLMDKNDIMKRFNETVEFGRKNCPQLLKTGWASIGEKNEKRSK
ncbi:MAG: hypothetical protein QMC67_06210 [Candidatus Wallbacteria bacterium]